LATTPDSAAHAAPSPAPAPAVPAASLASRIRRVLPHIAHVRRFWLVVLLATIVGAATEPAVPAMLKPLLDRGFQAGAFNPWWVPAALIGVFALRGIAGFIADVALAKIANEGMFELRRALFGRLLDARLDLFTRESSSSLANSIVHEVQQGFQLLVSALTALVKDSLALLALLGYLLYLDWQLTLIVGLMAPAVAWLMRTASRRLYRLAKSSQAGMVDLAYSVEENVLAHRVVRLHGAQPAQGRRFEKLSHALRRLAMKSAVAQALITPTMHMLAAVALSVVIMIALVRSGDGLTVGGFASFVTAMLMLIAPVKRLSEVTSPIARALVALERALDLVQHNPPETGGSHAPQRAQGQIELRSVTMQYPGSDRPALDGLSLTVTPGETLALVGPSGSGKTTLANLLPRFLDPSAGSIRLDGHELRDWQLAALRRQFAMVSQDVVMFNDSLAANVAVGAEVDARRVEEALHAANLGELLGQLPQGLDTPVGHNATALSGGQRQRLAIARALYKDAPILILDEATSALDNESERMVQEALRRLMAGRTTVIIAHRLSTIEHADRVAVLEHGRLAELGSHQELLARGGLYSRLHALGGAELADS
jgi:ATP-binding cassette, subfamily B, bacterial MsbA